MLKENKKFFRYFFLITLFLIFSCAKDFSTEKVQINLPKDIAKINGKYLIFIPEKELKLEKKFSSDDCESWSVKLNLNAIYKDSLIRLIYKMFENPRITSTQYSSKEIEKENFIAQIKILHDRSISTFKTENNMGIFNINLSSNILIDGKKKYETNVYSNSSWQKNVYVSCNLNKGAHKAAKSGIERLMNQIHSSVYESVFKYNRN